MIKQETDRLWENLKNLGWSKEDCAYIAPTTLKINKLKKEQDAVILGHSYQTPEIMYGVADFIGDSYGLSKIATEHPAKKIIFCSVHFMGETAKLLNPKKEVLVPDVAGCSLADSITPEDVKNLKKEHPDATVICYINTSADVKAESDICCTSANAVKIVNSVKTNKVVFIPDKFMGENLKKFTDKEIILWDGSCIVHEIFSPEEVDLVKKNHPQTKILAHLECGSEVVSKADMAGSTTDMIEYVKDHPNNSFMLITECGVTDRIKKEFPEEKIVGGCNLCPFMKKITLNKILKSLENPEPKMFINIPEETAKKARQTLDRMFKV